MKEELIHILDQSVCLTRRQMRDYIAGTMLAEEQHAAEVHLSSCPLCRMAMEGYEAHSEEALEAISLLNSGFLKEHYDAVTPQIHLNSVAPAMTATAHRGRGRTQPVWRNAAIAATIVLSAGLLWYFEVGKNRMVNSSSSRVLADKTEPSPPLVASVTPAPVITESLYLQKSSPLVPKEPSTATVKQREATENSGGLISNEPEHVEQGAIKQQSLSSPGTIAPMNGDSQLSVSNTKVSADEVAGNVNRAYGNSFSQSQNYSTNQVPSTTFKPESLPAPRNLERKSEVVHRSIEPARSSASKNEELLSSVEKGDELADKGKYGAAATEYKKEMADESNTSRQRHQAGILAAKAYINAGQKAKAVAILQNIIKEGGPQKRVAKRMLHDLQVGK